MFLRDRTAADPLKCMNVKLDTWNGSTGPFYMCICHIFFFFRKFKHQVQMEVYAISNKIVIADGLNNSPGTAKEIPALLLPPLPPADAPGAAAVMN